MNQPHALPAFSDNYIWVIADSEQKTFICVDPGDAQPVLSYARDTQFTLSAILLTHHHADHIGGVDELTSAFPKVKVYSPFDPRIPNANHPVKEYDTLSIGKYSFRVLYTPGHTSSHVCYHEPSMHWLFCGDTLFSAGCGRVFDGTMQALHNSLLKLRDLSDETQVFCGHEYTRNNIRFALTIEPNNQTLYSYMASLNKQLSLPSTIAIEKEINPFMRTDTLSLQEYARKEGLNSFDSLMIFTYLRDKKDLFN